MSGITQEAMEFGAIAALEARDECLMAALEIVRAVQDDASIVGAAVGDVICERLVAALAPEPEKRP